MEQRQRDRFAPFPLRGELDLSNADDLLTSLLAHARDTAGEVLCDCSELDYMDSSALAVLIEVHSSLAEDGRPLRLVNVHGSPLRVLEITGLAERFVDDRNGADAS
ncbi:MAG TPA: STAS domain-containing protein [Acidimicrobiia bacterium]|nr:STAS domain-containing protein [Acidimicrobiia bacterium]